MFTIHKCLLMAVLFCAMGLTASDAEEMDEDIFIREEQCRFCLQDVPSLIGFPCLHQCLCSSCILTWEKKGSSCPVCRGHLENKITVQRLERKQAEHEQNEDIVSKFINFIFYFTTNKF